MSGRKTIVAVLCALASLPGATAWAQESSSDRGALVDSARATLEKWVETQKIISKERSEWQTGREVLGQRIALIESEIRSLREKIAETREGIREAEDKRRELLERKASLKGASASLSELIGPLEQKTQRLVSRLPRSVRDRVSVLAQRIPDEPRETESSLSERFQNVIGILNEVNKFNQNITVTSELRELDGGRTAEVQTLYVGLGHAYFVTPDGKTAGTGSPAEEGWSWTVDNTIADEVQRAIAIYQDEEVPDYVPLPVTIQ
jgi:septal ring factor EnvC (AmiA/AmiB activator)